MKRILLHYILIGFLILPLITTLTLAVAGEAAGGYYDCRHGDIRLKPIGTYKTKIFDEGAAEIVAHDPETQRLFVTNAADNTIDVIDINKIRKKLKLEFQIDLSHFGAKPNSVAVKNGIVAVAVENDDIEGPGKVVFFDPDGVFQNEVNVGILPDGTATPDPDMLIFTPDGRWLLVANEGVPEDEITVDPNAVDPEGSVSIIKIKKDIRNLTQADVRTADFRKFNKAVLAPSIRVFIPGATVAEDIEPEFIAVSADSRRAWVTLQENNAFAVINIRRAKVTKLIGLGFKNHRRRGNALDASNEDGRIRIRRWPVKGMYLPDAIASYEVKIWGRNWTFLVTANEGDGRDFTSDDCPECFNEEVRIKDVDLDPVRFPNAAVLQLDENLGRLRITNTLGDTDGDGDFDKLFPFGARSFSIWNAWGEQVFDSGDDFEQITAEELPDEFNSTNDENDSFDDRSDDKGPEPKGVTVGKVCGKTYAFIGLERIGGIMVYNVSRPWAPFFVQYINTRKFRAKKIEKAGDLSPEGLAFIPREDSPIDKPLLVAAFEVSGSTTIFEINPIKGDDHDDDYYDEYDDDDDDG